MVFGEPPASVRVPAPFDTFYFDEQARAGALAISLTGSAQVGQTIALRAFLDARRDWDDVGREEAPELSLYATIANWSTSRSRVASARLATRLGFADLAPDLDLDPDSHEARFVRSLAPLPPDVRRVAALRWVAGLSVPSIAQAIDRDRDHVVTDLATARTRLIDRGIAQARDVDDRAAEAGAGLRAAVVARAPADLDTAAETQRRVRNKTALATTVAVLAAFFVFIGIASLAGSGVPEAAPTSTAAPTTAPPTTLTLTQQNETHGYSVDVPSTWVTSTEPLVGPDEDRVVVFAAGTSQLPAGQSGCARAPLAVTRPPAGSAAIVILEDPSHAAGALPPLGELTASALTDSEQPRHCASTDGRFGLVAFESAGRGFSVWWGLGADASQVTRRDLRRVIASFEAQ